MFITYLQSSTAAEGVANLLDPLFLLFAIGIIVTLFVLWRLLREPPEKPDVSDSAQEHAGKSA